MDGSSDEPRKDAGAVSDVFDTSNGHHWVKWRTLVCCRDCGFIRRTDDSNKPCRGRVFVGPRS